MATEAEDITSIKDEDVLRRMWQNTEDFARKKEIRARMYKLREQRLREFYTTGEVLSDVQSVTPQASDEVSKSEITHIITKHNNGAMTLTDSIEDQGFMALKSKEIRDSESPTREFQTVQSNSRDNNSQSYWKVESSSDSYQAVGSGGQYEVTSQSERRSMAGENDQIISNMATSSGSRSIMDTSDGLWIQTDGNDTSGRSLVSHDMLNNGDTVLCTTEGGSRAVSVSGKMASSHRSTVKSQQSQKWSSSTATSSTSKVTGSKYDSEGITRDYSDRNVGDVWTEKGPDGVMRTVRVVEKVEGQGDQGGVTKITRIVKTTGSTGDQIVDGNSTAVRTVTVTKTMRQPEVMETDSRTTEVIETSVTPFTEEHFIEDGSGGTRRVITKIIRTSGVRDDGNYNIEGGSGRTVMTEKIVRTVGRSGDDMQRINEKSSHTHRHEESRCQTVDRKTISSNDIQGRETTQDVMIDNETTDTSKKVTRNEQITSRVSTQEERSRKTLEMERKGFVSQTGKTVTETVTSEKQKPLLKSEVIDDKHITKKIQEESGVRTVDSHTRHESVKIDKEGTSIVREKEESKKPESKAKPDQEPRAEQPKQQESCQTPQVVEKIPDENLQAKKPEPDTHTHGSVTRRGESQHEIQTTRIIHDTEERTDVQAVRKTDTAKDSPRREPEMDSAPTDMRLNVIEEDKVPRNDIKQSKDVVKDMNTVQETDKKTGSYTTTYQWSFTPQKINIEVSASHAAFASSLRAPSLSPERAASPYRSASDITYTCGRRSPTKSTSRSSLDRTTPTPRKSYTPEPQRTNKTNTVKTPKSPATDDRKPKTKPGETRSLSPSRKATPVTIDGRPIGKTPKDTKAQPKDKRKLPGSRKRSGTPGVSPSTSPERDTDKTGKRRTTSSSSESSRLTYSREIKTTTDEKYRGVTDFIQREKDREVKTAPRTPGVDRLREKSPEYSSDGSLIQEMSPKGYPRQPSPLAGLKEKGFKPIRSDDEAVSKPRRPDSSSSSPSTSPERKMSPQKTLGKNIIKDTPKKSYNDTKKPKHERVTPDGRRVQSKIESDDKNMESRQKPKVLKPQTEQDGKRPASKPIKKKPSEQDIMPDSRHAPRRKPEEEETQYYETPDERKAQRKKPGMGRDEDDSPEDYQAPIDGTRTPGQKQFIRPDEDDDVEVPQEFVKPEDTRTPRKQSRKPGDKPEDYYTIPDDRKILRKPETQPETEPMDYYTAPDGQRIPRKPGSKQGEEPEDYYTSPDDSIIPRKPGTKPRDEPDDLYTMPDDRQFPQKPGKKPEREPENYHTTPDGRKVPKKLGTKPAEEPEDYTITPDGKRVPKKPGTRPSEKPQGFRVTPDGRKVTQKPGTKPGDEPDDYHITPQEGRTPREPIREAEDDIPEDYYETPDGKRIPGKPTKKPRDEPEDYFITPDGKRVPKIPDTRPSEKPQGFRVTPDGRKVTKKPGTKPGDEPDDYHTTPQEGRTPREPVREAEDDMPEDYNETPDGKRIPGKPTTEPRDEPEDYYTTPDGRRIPRKPDMKPEKEPRDNYTYPDVRGVSKKASGEPGKEPEDDHVSPDEKIYSGKPGSRPSDEPEGITPDGIRVIKTPATRPGEKPEDFRVTPDGRKVTKKPGTKPGDEPDDYHTTPQEGRTPREPVREAEDDMPEDYYETPDGKRIPGKPTTEPRDEPEDYYTTPDGDTVPRKPGTRPGDKPQDYYIAPDGRKVYRTPGTKPEQEPKDYYTTPDGRQVKRKPTTRPDCELYDEDTSPSDRLPRKEPEDEDEYYDYGDVPIQEYVTPDGRKAFRKALKRNEPDDDHESPRKQPSYDDNEPYNRPDVGKVTEKKEPGFYTTPDGRRVPLSRTKPSEKTPNDCRTSNSRTSKKPVMKPSDRSPDDGSRYAPGKKHPDNNRQPGVKTSNRAPDQFQTLPAGKTTVRKPDHEYVTPDGRPVSNKRPIGKSLPSTTEKNPVIKSIGTTPKMVPTTSGTKTVPGVRKPEPNYFSPTRASMVKRPVGPGKTLTGRPKTSPQDEPIRRAPAVPAKPVKKRPSFEEEPRRGSIKSTVTDFIRSERRTEIRQQRVMKTNEEYYDDQPSDYPIDDEDGYSPEGTARKTPKTTRTTSTPIIKSKTEPKTKKLLPQQKSEPKMRTTNGVSPKTTTPISPLRKEPSSTKKKPTGRIHPTGKQPRDTKKPERTTSESSEPEDELQYVRDTRYMEEDRQHTTKERQRIKVKSKDIPEDGRLREPKGVIEFPESPRDASPDGHPRYTTVNENRVEELRPRYPDSVTEPEDDSEDNEEYEPRRIKGKPDTLLEEDEEEPRRRKTKKTPDREESVDDIEETSVSVAQRVNKFMESARKAGSSPLPSRPEDITLKGLDDTINSYIENNDLDEEIDSVNAVRKAKTMFENIAYNTVNSSAKRELFRQDDILSRPSVFDARRKDKKPDSEPSDEETQKRVPEMTEKKPVEPEVLRKENLLKLGIRCPENIFNRDIFEKAEPGKDTFPRRKTPSPERPVGKFDTYPSRKSPVKDDYDGISPKRTSPERRISPEKERRPEEPISKTTSKSSAVKPVTSRYPFSKPKPEEKKPTPQKPIKTNNVANRYPFSDKPKDTKVNGYPVTRESHPSKIPEDSDLKAPKLLKEPYEGYPTRPSDDTLSRRRDSPQRSDQPTDRTKYPDDSYAYPDDKTRRSESPKKEYPDRVPTRKDKSPSPGSRYYPDYKSPTERRPSEKDYTDNKTPQDRRPSGKGYPGDKSPTERCPSGKEYPKEMLPSGRRPSGKDYPDKSPTSRRPSERDYSGSTSPTGRRPSGKDYPDDRIPTGRRPSGKDYPDDTSPTTGRQSERDYSGSTSPTGRRPSGKDYPDDRIPTGRRPSGKDYPDNTSPMSRRPSERDYTGSTSPTSRRPSGKDYPDDHIPAGRRPSGKDYPDVKSPSRKSPDRSPVDSRRSPGRKQSEDGFPRGRGPSRHSGEKSPGQRSSPERSPVDTRRSPGRKHPEDSFPYGRRPSEKDYPYDKTSPRSSSPTSRRSSSPVMRHPSARDYPESQRPGQKSPTRPDTKRPKDRSPDSFRSRPSPDKTYDDRDRPREGSPRTFVDDSKISKFGVTLRKTSTGSSIMKKLFADVGRKQSELDRIFDLEVLETLLERAKGYDERRLIRQQIRLVKKMIENNELPDQPRRKSAQYDYDSDTPKERDSPLNKPDDRRNSTFRSSKSPEKTTPNRRSPEKSQPGRYEPFESSRRQSQDGYYTTDVRRQSTERTEHFTSTVEVTTKRTNVRQSSKTDIIDKSPEIKSPQIVNKAVKKSLIEDDTREESLTDSITSGYGIGPTDEKGMPLFGLKALRRQNKTTPEVEPDFAPREEEPSPRDIKDSSGRPLFGLKALQISKSPTRNSEEKPNSVHRDKSPLKDLVNRHDKHARGNAVSQPQQHTPPRMRDTFAQSRNEDVIRKESEVEDVNRTMKDSGQSLRAMIQRHESLTESDRRKPETVTSSSSFSSSTVVRSSAVRKPDGTISVKSHVVQGETVSRDGEKPKSRITTAEYSYETPEDGYDMISDEERQTVTRKTGKTVSSRSNTTDSVLSRTSRKSVSPERKSPESWRREDSTTKPSRRPISDKLSHLSRKFSNEPEDTERKPLSHEPKADPHYSSHTRSSLLHSNVYSSTTHTDRNVFSRYNPDDDTSGKRRSSTPQDTSINRRRSSTPLDELKESLFRKSSTTHEETDASSSALFTRYGRGGAVKALSQKFQQAGAEAESPKSTASYPKAGLILRSASFKHTNGDLTPPESPGYKQSVSMEVRVGSPTRNVNTTPRSSHDSKLTSTNERITDRDESRRWSRDDATEYDSYSETNRSVSSRTVMEASDGKSFLGSNSKVTGVQDIISRMKAADHEDVGFESPEDVQARSLLNKFLGASVMMSGMEPLVKASGNSSATLVSQVERQRILQSSPTDNIGSKNYVTTENFRDYDNIDNIWDERKLRQLLDACTDYEGRRKIRARLRTVMAEKSACEDVVAAAQEESEKSGDGSRSVQAGESLLPYLVEQLRTSLILESRPGHSQKHDEGISMTHMEDSGTESGEDLRLLVGLRDSICEGNEVKKTEQLNKKLLVEVQEALQKLQISLNSGAENSLDPVTRETLLQLVTRLQSSLRLAPGVAQNSEVKPQNKNRFANRRLNRQNRHTVGVTREELANARRLIQESSLTGDCRTNFIDTGQAEFMSKPDKLENAKPAGSEQPLASYAVVKQNSADDVTSNSSTPFKLFRPMHFNPGNIRMPVQLGNAIAKPFLSSEQIQSADEWVRNQIGNTRRLSEGCTVPSSNYSASPCLSPSSIFAANADAIDESKIGKLNCSNPENSENKPNIPKSPSPPYRNIQYAPSVFSPTQFEATNKAQSENPKASSLSNGSFSQGLVHSQSVTDHKKMARTHSPIKHSVSVENGDSILEYDPSLRLFTPEQSVKIAVHKAAINKQLSQEGEKRMRKMSIESDIGSTDDEAMEGDGDVSSVTDDEDESTVKLSKLNNNANNYSTLNNQHGNYQSSGLSAYNSYDQTPNHFPEVRNKPLTNADMNPADNRYQNFSGKEERPNYKRNISDDTKKSQPKEEPMNRFEKRIQEIQNDRKAENRQKVRSIEELQKIYSDRKEKYMEKKNHPDSRSQMIQNVQAKYQKNFIDHTVNQKTYNPQRLNPDIRSKYENEIKKNIENDMRSKPIWNEDENDRRKKESIKALDYLTALEQNGLDLPQTPMDVSQTESEISISSTSTENSISHAQRLLRLATGEKSGKHYSKSSKKVKMKRANTIDIPKPLNYYGVEDDYSDYTDDEQKHNTYTSTVKSMKPTVPMLEPKTESDKKFLALLRQQNQPKITNAIWTKDEEPQRRNPFSEHQWGNRFSRIKTAFENVDGKKEVITRQIPVSSAVTGARAFWKSADDSAAVIKSHKDTLSVADRPKLTRQGSIFLKKLFQQKENDEKPTRLPWTSQRDVVVGSLTVYPQKSEISRINKANVNQFSHAPMSAFRPVERKIDPAKMYNGPPVKIAKPVPVIPDKQALGSTLPWLKERSDKTLNSAVAKFESLSSRETSPTMMSPRPKIQERVNLAYSSQEVPVRPITRSPSQSNFMQMRTQAFTPNYPNIKIKADIPPEPPKVECCPYPDTSNKEFFSPVTTYSVDVAATSTVYPTAQPDGIDSFEYLIDSAVSTPEEQMAITKVMGSPVQQQAVTVRQKTHRRNDEDDNRMSAAKNLTSMLQRFSSPPSDRSPEPLRPRGSVPDITYTKSSLLPPNLPTGKTSPTSLTNRSYSPLSDVSVKAKHDLQFRRPSSAESLALSNSSEELRDPGEPITPRLQIPVGPQYRTSSLQDLSPQGSPTQHIPNVPPTGCLRKSESCHQLTGQKPKRPQSLIIPDLPTPQRKTPTSLMKTKSSHALTFPKQFEAVINPAAVEMKQKTVEEYFQVKKKTKKEVKTDLVVLDDNLENVDEAFDALFSSVTSNKCSAKKSDGFRQRPNTNQISKSISTSAIQRPRNISSSSVTTTTKSSDGGYSKITSEKSVFSTVSSSKAASTNKPISPFAKFQQLDRQNSSSSTPSSPSAGKAPLFTFTDPKLSRSASGVKDRLLQWCQMKTKNYKNIQIENFSTSWSNGLAFCALIHHFRPEAFDYDALSPRERRKNFELAFKVAEDEAGIAPLLDVEDMVMMKKPDWKCVFTYVQSIYCRFKNED